MVAGASIAVGIALGTALWLITDNIVFLAAGVALGAAFSAVGYSTSDDTDDGGAPDGSGSDPQR